MKTYNHKLNILSILMIWLVAFNCSPAQNDNKSFLSKTTEEIIKYNLDDGLFNNISYLKPVGYSQNRVVYQCVDNNQTVTFYSLNENNHKFTHIYKEVSFDRMIFSDFFIRDSIMFYTKRFSKSIDDDGYNELLIQRQEKQYTLDKIFNKDKIIHSNISTDSKILIVNTLNTLSDYYDPTIDDNLIVYSLDSLSFDKIKKRLIPCLHCADAHLVGDNLFFTKSNRRDDFSDGFEWTDIYVAPWQNLADSIKIAAYSDILAVSPDGKYLLIKRNFDLPNGPRAIMDVASKKYQLLLGRDYSKATGFYSYAKKKFAFHFKDRIVYVDFPEDYPFDALRKGNPDIPNWTEKSFYEQYRHAPFDE